MAAVAPASAPSGFASGHYHFSVEAVGRGKGASVMHKAAYRSGDCLYDERSGEWTNDYRGRAHSVIDSFVMARDEAPAWMQHAAREARQRAWNEAERAEPRANGRLATELVVGLPHELTDAQRKELLSAFVRRLVEKHGVFADVAIHTAHDERNIHAHVLLSHRELGPEGFGEIANRRTITKKVKGQEKQIGIAGLAATPADIKHLREVWARDVNRAYEKAGLDIRVDHRSFEDRGIKDVPTIHLGPTAAKMEREGKHSDRGDINRIIEFGNAELRQREAEKQRQDAQIIDLAAKLAERQAQQAAKGRLDGIQPEFEEGDAQPSRAARRRAARQAEHDEMDQDIAAKQRQERQQIEDKEAASFTDMVADKNRAERYLQEWQISHDHGERNKKSLQEQLYRRDLEDGITDVRVRALLAAGESRDFVQAVRVEGVMITREHLDLQRDIALEDDPDKKQMLEFRRDIQHADYMALANERVAAMSNLNGEQYKEAMRQQEEWQKTGTELRKERLELQDRMAEREAAEINAKVEAHVEQLNRADRQREEFRSDIRGSASGTTAAQVEDMAARFAQDHEPTPEERARQEAYAGARGRRDDIGPLPETAREAAEAHEAAAQPSAPGQPERPIGEPERPAEVAYSTPARPLEQEAAAETPAREATDARQVEQQNAEHEEITDPKAAAKARWARHGAQVEQAIEGARDRGYGRDM
jgi:MobA/MobL family